MLEVNASGTCIIVTAEHMIDYMTAQHMIATMAM